MVYTPLSSRSSSKHVAKVQSFKPFSDMTAMKACRLRGFSPPASKRYGRRLQLLLIATKPASSEGGDPGPRQPQTVPPGADQCHASTSGTGSCLFCCWLLPEVDAV